MIPAAGQMVGPYEILGRLGSGGMGLVFSAWDSRLHRDVAIKLLRDEFVREDSRERFLQEARAASGLNHPNICTVFDIGEQDGDPYLVMELLKGETLRARILTGPMTAEEILHVGMEVAEALVAAHARGIIHRDLKPANIFLVARPTGGWQAKVLDFGLAQIDGQVGLDAHQHMTEVGTTVGTVSYMSPEQARGEELDARSDLFGVGILLYEMAMGHTPFRGATSALVAVQLLNHPPEPIREFNKNIPRDFEDIILKLLAKDRSERFQSAVDLLIALQGVVLKKPMPARFAWLSKASMLAASEDAEAAETKSNSATPLPGPSAAGRSPSSEVIRPIPRRPLPPVTLEPSIAHWVRSPLPTVEVITELPFAPEPASAIIAQESAVEPLVAPEASLVELPVAPEPASTVVAPEPAVELIVAPETSPVEPPVAPEPVSAIAAPKPVAEPLAAPEKLPAELPPASEPVSEIVTSEPTVLIPTEPARSDVAALRAAALQHVIEQEQRLMKVRRRRWLLWVVTALATLMFAGIIYWKHWKRVHQPKPRAVAILQLPPAQTRER